MKDLKCILLVDDDEATNFMNKTTIKRLNSNVVVQTASNGQEALEYLSSTGKFSNNQAFLQPDIIFLDINMPGMNGWDFLESYNKLSEKQKGKIVIIMLTTSFNPDDKEKANTFSTIKGFLNKPLTIEKVKRVIDSYQ